MIKNLNLYVIACLVGIVFACSRTHSSTSDVKIVGGAPSADGAWLGAVALTDVPRGNEQWCTGTALTSRLIVLAAHCVDDMGSVTDRRIYVGSGNDSGVLDAPYTVKRFSFHPRYNLSNGFDGVNDVAYLVLDKPLELPPEAYIPVLRDLKEIEELLQPQKPATLVGFGKRENQVKGTKYETTVEINQVGQREIHMGGNGKDSCHGDSGGPAYAQLANGEWRVFGIVSRGPDCGSGGTWGLIHPHLCWIQQDSGENLGLTSEDCLGESLFVQTCEEPAKAYPYTLATVQELQKLTHGGSCREQFKNLTATTTLYLNDRDWLDGAILSEITALTKLNLKNTPVYNTRHFHKLRDLKELNLHGSQVDSLSDISDLPSLEKLDLSSMKLKSVKGLEGAVQLRELRLSFNQLKDVSGLKALFMLEKLYLDNNQITSLEPLADLQELQQLSFTNNLVSSIAEISGLSNLAKIYANMNLIAKDPQSCPMNVPSKGVSDFCR